MQEREGGSLEIAIFRKLSAIKPFFEQNIKILNYAIITSMAGSYLHFSGLN